VAVYFFVAYTANMKRSLETAPRSPQTYQTRSWNENVLHVYPRTFNEARPEGEAHLGIGSILGIIEKLDWMKETGVTAIWLGPIYKSPGRDGNYDIANYYEANPELGSLDDVKLLIEEAHRRDIRVIFDLVPNHTSDESKWFEASHDPDHPDHATYKDYYIWRDPRVGELPEGIVGEDRLMGLPDGLTVPNNWTSIFSLPQIDKLREQHGGAIPDGVRIPAVTAWVWNEKRGQFYLAEFMKEQPTLNWNNPQVRDEIKDVVRFWLDLGVDSFRVDVMNHIGKDVKLRDELPAPIGSEVGQYNPGVTNPHDQWRQERMVSHYPELGEYAKDLLSILDEEPYRERNIRFVFEDWMSALDGDVRLDQLRPDKANVFNFEMLLNTTREHWTARNIGRIVAKYYARLGTLEGVAPNQVTGNHDVDTLRTRLGSAMSARAAFLMLSALPGNLYTWQGDTMGRANVLMPDELQKDKDIGKRDGERVPMQWNDDKNAGFSDADELWLPAVDPHIYRGDNLELQARDPASPYRLVKRALLRRMKDVALREGSIRLLHADHPDVLAFVRPDPSDSRRQVISVTNLSQNTVQTSILDAHQTRGRVTLSASGRNAGEVDLEGRIELEPDESYIIDTIG